MMKRYPIPKLAVLLFVAIPVLLFFGCRGMPWPFGPSPFPTIHNIWPNEDGTSWTYDYEWRIFQEYEQPRLYDTPDAVPPVPSMRDLAEFKDTHPVGDDPDVTEMIYRLQFDGMITTASGVTAQNLREIICTVETNETVGGKIGVTEAFLARLAAARPDLRRAIHDRLAAIGADGIAISWPPFDEEERATRDTAHLLQGDFRQAFAKPVLIHGYAWEKTSRWIGTYGDLDRLLAYKFLESNLFPGHEFTHQLVPELADDVFLYCRVLRRFNYRTPHGNFPNALECIYAIDYGIAALHGIGGDSGYYRLFDYGTVIYAPNRGPVYSYERNLVQTGESLSIGVGDKIVTIVGTTAGRQPSNPGEAPAR